MDARPNKGRKSLGISTVEVALSSIVAIIFSALTADVTIAMYAFFINDMCARDCARAAGSVAVNGSSSSLSTASTAGQYAATNQLTVHGTDGYFISGLSGEHHPTLLTTGSNWQYAPDGWPPTQALPANYNPFAPSGTITAPRVVATTAVLVRLPFNPGGLGTQFRPNSSNQVQFNRSYCFPIVNIALTSSNN